MENKYTGMKAAIVILCLLVVGLTEYIVYDKLLNQDSNEIFNIEDNNSNNIVSNNNTQSESSNLPEWANYLLNQDITEIIYEDGVLLYDELNDTEKCTQSKTITKEQLKSILSKMTTSKLRKFDAGGFGGPCWSGIIIKYDNKEFKIFMGKYIIIDNNDSNVLSLLEKENYELESKVNPEPLWTYEYDWDTSYIDTLF